MAGASVEKTVVRSPTTGNAITGRIGFSKHTPATDGERSPFPSARPPTAASGKYRRLVIFFLRSSASVSDIIWAGLCRPVLHRSVTGERFRRNGPTASSNAPSVGDILFSQGRVGSEGISEINRR